MSDRCFRCFFLLLLFLTLFLLDVIVWWNTFLLSWYSFFHHDSVKWNVSNCVNSICFYCNIPLPLSLLVHRVTDYVRYHLYYDRNAVPWLKWTLKWKRKVISTTAPRIGAISKSLLYICFLTIYLSNPYLHFFCSFHPPSSTLQL